MVSRDEGLTSPSPSSATPLHGEGMDRLFQMQKDLGKQEALNDSIHATLQNLDKRMDKMEQKLDKHADVLSTIKITTFVLLALASLATLFTKVFTLFPSS